eukprot:scaffold384_cov139-Chaetoceros_neogracile.AAC.1
MLHVRAECNELTTSTRRYGKGAVPFIYPRTTSYCSRIIGENDIDFLLCSDQHFINPHTLNSFFRSHYSKYAYAYTSMMTYAVSQRTPNKRQVVGKRQHQAARSSSLSRSKKGGGGCQQCFNNDKPSPTCVHVAGLSSNFFRNWRHACDLGGEWCESEVATTVVEPRLLSSHDELFQCDQKGNDIDAEADFDTSGSSVSLSSEGLKTKSTKSRKEGKGPKSTKSKKSRRNVLSLANNDKGGVKAKEGGSSGGGTLVEFVILEGGMN